MRFLVDEDLPRSTDDLLRRYGHEAVDVRDISLKLVEGFLHRGDVVTHIPGKLAIVEPGRVRIRTT